MIGHMSLIKKIVFADLQSGPKTAFQPSNRELAHQLFQIRPGNKQSLGLHWNLSYKPLILSNFSSSDSYLKQNKTSTRLRKIKERWKILFEYWRKMSATLIKSGTCHKLKKCTTTRNERNLLKLKQATLKLQCTVYIFSVLSQLLYRWATDFLNFFWNVLSEALSV